MFQPQPVPKYVPPKAEKYALAAESPQPIIKGVRVDTAGPTHMAVVEVSPVRMTRRGELELCTLVEVAIETVPKPPQPPLSGKEYERAVSIFKERFPRSFEPARVIARPAAFISNRAEAKLVQNVAISQVINGSIINPDNVSDYLDRTMAAEYLIITDDKKWDADKIAPSAGGALPGMIAAFEKLAQAKQARGLTARLVSIANIVAGKYGDVRTGSRDLQEVIRRFLKLVREQWGVRWLLLGVNCDIVPVRRVAGEKEGWIDPKAGQDPPDKGSSFWTGSYLKMNVDGIDVAGVAATNRTLVRRETGDIIPYDANGTSNAAKPGWYFTQDNKYAKRTAHATPFVRVEGPPALAEAGLIWLWDRNMIPTDFYYSSLSSFVPAQTVWNAAPYVYVPAHDWDAIDNGLYAQENSAGYDLDGVVLHVDISVGRAPASNATEAAVFVNKTLAYERLDRSRAAGITYATLLRPGNAPASNWPRKMLLASQDFGARIVPILPTVKPGDPPTKGNTEEYSYDASKPRSLIKIKDDNKYRNMTDWQIFARISDRERIQINYKTSKGATNPAMPGWYYAKSDTDPTPSVQVVTISGVMLSSEIPVPTLWIVIHGSLAELTPQSYELRERGADLSMVQQEDLRCQLLKELPGIDRFDRYYEDENDLNVKQRMGGPVTNLTYNNLCAGLNAAPHFVSLSGHGNTQYCCTLDNSNVAALTNGYPGFITNAVSCLTNDFTDQAGLSTRLMNNPNGGAVAYIGNTRNGFMGIGDDYERAFFHTLTATRNLGALDDSRLALTEDKLGHYGTGDRWSIFVLNLLGDPELQVMVAGAQPTMHVLDTVIDVDNPTIHIIAIPKDPIPTPDPGPLRDALVHVRQVETGKVWMGRTDEKGEVVVPKGVLKRGKGRVEITASKDGFPVAVQQATVEGGSGWRQMRDGCLGLLCGLGGKKDGGVKVKKDSVA